MLRFFDFVENLRLSHRIQCILIILLSMLVCTLSITNAYLALTKNHFILPYEWNRPIKIARHIIDPYYLGQLGLSDATLYFNVQTQNIHDQSQWFLSRVWVKYRNTLHKKLNQREQYFRLHGCMQVFYPEKYTVQTQSNRVDLYGELIRWLGSRVLERQAIHIHINYKNIGGHLYVQSWEEEKK